MTNIPRDENKDEECKGLDCAEKTLHESVAQSHPEWVDPDGECQSCVSIEHELAAEPNAIPEEFLEEKEAPEDKIEDNS